MEDTISDKSPVIFILFKYIIQKLDGTALDSDSNDQNGQNIKVVKMVKMVKMVKHGSLTQCAAVFYLVAEGD